MSYSSWDEPYYPEYLGCPVCHEPSSETWIEVSKDDPKYASLIDTLKCRNCGVYFDFAQQHFDKLFSALQEELEPTDPDPIDYDWQLSEKERLELEETQQEAELERLKEAGFLDKNGNPTDAYYRESDFQYDCMRERSR